MHTNIYGEALIPCSNSPLTGFYRNGCCDTDKDDVGVHSVCVIVTKEFLEYSKSIGNDLITPMPEWRFPGLVPGDRYSGLVDIFLHSRTGLDDDGHIDHVYDRELNDSRGQRVRAEPGLE